MWIFFFSSRRRHTSCALVTGVQTCALPIYLPFAARLGWRSADCMWRLAGDTATDYNHYSKRTILGTVYGSTVAVFLDDESEDFADTRAFLARRIDAVMRFEGWKHRRAARRTERSEEHTSELQSLMRISYAVFCLKKKINTNQLDRLHITNTH